VFSSPVKNLLSQCRHQFNLHSVFKFSIDFQKVYLNDTLNIDSDHLNSQREVSFTSTLYSTGSTGSLLPRNEVSAAAINRAQSTLAGPLADLCPPVGLDRNLKLTNQATQNICQSKRTDVDSSVVTETKS